ncbi:ANTAR domain-containing protein [Rhodococcus globerulus]|uniref:ANTAR domain-containing protein n=1 Tax=Rhodococcus globerulus TaxID=33008 RepID=A0ABU4C4E2_RHOGO|nr:ANTAR domain-containing protein [Rhodococcus globerulus]MDV6271379.1 ANTAR domain-containing protein [Rhodococcus globerulus]
MTDRRSGLIASLADREVIEQAQGLIMKRTGFAADLALAFMKAEAAGHSLPVPDLARYIVSKQPYGVRV